MIVTPKSEPKVKSKIQKFTEVEKLTPRKLETPKKTDPKIDLDELQKFMDQMAINNQANNDSVSEQKVIEEPKITPNQDLAKGDLNWCDLDYFDRSVRLPNFDDTRKRLEFFLLGNI